MLPCLLRTPAANAAANAARPPTAPTSLLKAIGGSSSPSPSPRPRPRAFTGTVRPYEKALPPRPKIPTTEIEEKFLKGTGPGGQKINKTSCAVQLRHLPTGIVVKSQETRSREQNRKFARDILADKLDRLEKGDQSRSAIKADRARSKKASKAKKSRRKYRKLEEEGKERGQDVVVTEEGWGERHDSVRMAEEGSVDDGTRSWVLENKHESERDGKT